MKIYLGLLLIGGIFCSWVGTADQVSPEPAMLKGTQVCSLFVEKPGTKGVVFSPDGSRVLVYGENGPSLWEISVGRKIADLHYRSSGDKWRYGGNLHFSGDGKRILGKAEIGGSSKCLYTIWDAVDGAPLGKPQISDEDVLPFFRINQLSPDGSLFLGMGKESWAVHDVTKEGINSSFRQVAPEGWCFKYSPDSRKAAFFWPGGKVSVWDLQRGKKLWSRPKGETKSLFMVRFSEDGAAVFVSDREGEHAEIYDLEHNRSLAKINGKDEKSEEGVQFLSELRSRPFSMMCFDPGKKKMWKADLPVSLVCKKLREAVDAFNALNGTKNFIVGPCEIFYVTLDGHYAVVARISGYHRYGDGGYKRRYEPVMLIWDIKKKRISGEVVHWPPLIDDMEVSPAEKYLHFLDEGGGSTEGIVPLATGIPMKVPGRILAFSADDSMIAWLDGETVRIWNISEGAEGAH